MSKETTAGNEIFRAMQLEQEKLSRLRARNTLTSARLPEIDLVNVGKLA